MSQTTDESDARTVYDKTLSLKNGRVKINYTATLHADGTLNTENQMTVDGQNIDSDWFYKEMHGEDDVLKFWNDVEIDGQEVSGVQLRRADDRQQVQQIESEFGQIVAVYDYVDDVDAMLSDLDAGERQFVYDNTQGCDDYNKECSTDKVEYYLCADGSVETERVHLH
ncbi:hypothetical protein [Halolamina salifodinae]|uniref:Uncharacterized protein n=1 Tax=Halolamina salifodinae TaxID=1202767 RepID=A0A8T4GVP8_9EURY|nr:hypothetical protein [Halolamina salifodinae]MBP1986986.1 hypothetical protein [Halolamina salifodinae]